MSQPVTFTVTQAAGCASLILTDTTVYGSNYGEIASTLITIETDGGTYTFDSFMPTPDVDSVQIYSSQLGYDTEPIPDQIMQITYVVYSTAGSGGILGQAESPWLACCIFLGCLFTQTQRVISNACCNKRELADILGEMWIEFLGIQSAVNCKACCAVGSMEQLSAQCAKLCLTGGCQ